MNPPSDNQPTVGAMPPAGTSGGNETSFHPHLVHGAGPQLKDETSKLLGSRLLAGSVFLLAILSAVLARAILVGETQFLTSDLAALVLLGAACLLLWRSGKLDLGQLRAVEIGIGLTLCGMLAYNNYVATTALAANTSLLRPASALPMEIRLLQNAGQLLPFIWLMMLYGIFIPNDWRRAARVLFPVAILPIAVRIVIVAGQPELARLVTFSQLSQSLLLLGIGYASGVYGTHVISTLRKEAFQARKMGYYELVDQIGRGGMGEVWRARHLMLARPAAIKLIRPDVLARPGSTDVSQILGRFEREAQATATLTSPHAVMLYDFGITDDQVFYQVMELLEGLDLDTLVRQHGPQNPQRVIALLSQACDALADAHAKGLIHRDIKPANIFACRLGQEVDFVKVLDFGLVKAVDAPPEAELTQIGMTTGTPAYIAPEQALGEEIDGRADLYALGCVGYWLLTGSTLFPAASGVSLLLEHVKTEPVPPSERSDQPIPEDLENVILSCLRKQRGERPQDAATLQSMLQACRASSLWTQTEARAWWERQVAADRQDDGQGPIANPEATLTPKTTRA